MLYPVLVGTQGLHHEVQGTEMPISRKNAIELSKVIMSMTKPNQEIGLVALKKVTGLTSDQVYSGLRVLRKDGLATLTIRVKHDQGSLVKFFPTPIPEDQRDGTTFRNLPRAPRKVNGLFHMTKTFNVEGGTYTAEQLEPLARAVLKELGQ